MEPEPEATTDPPWSSHAIGAPRRAIAISVLYHPDLARIGDVAILFDRETSQTARIGRSAPVFRKASGPTTAPLRVAQVSDREPLRVTGLHSGAVRIDPGPRMRVALEGKPLVDPVELDGEQLDRGAVLVLGNVVALLLHTTDVELRELPELGIAGHSRAVRALRAEILRVADRDIPVLLRGETGVGKELVACALHEQGPRKSGPFVPVNMAAIPASMAEAELFGYTRGAFTGATSNRAGHFELADGGTLFLDEIGDAPADVQAKLLRVVEHKEIQPLGSRARKVDVRLVAATDSDLERAVAAGTFRRPLLERMSGYVLRVPPLRERRDDIPRLFLRFLQAELVLQGEQDRLLSHSGGRPWLPPSFVLRLLAHDWPGNVRELLNAARQVAVANRGLEVFRVPEPLQRLPRLAATSTTPGDLDTGGPTLPPPPDALSDRAVTSASSPPLGEPSRAPSPARTLTDAQIVAALERNAFNIARTAAELRVSRTTLHTRMGACPDLRNATDLGDAEVADALAACGGDTTLAAARLRVSDRAFVLRARRLPEK